MYNSKIKLIKIKNNLKRKRPKFHRVESWRYKRLKPNWRKPRGLDNKARHKFKGGVKSPNVGYRTPKKVRNLHPSGYYEVVISNLKDIENLNPKRHAIKFSSKLGLKKKQLLLKKIKELRFKVLNMSIKE